jgi:hypothetical protein
MVFERYWLFALCCAVVLAFVIRLVLRERLALQHSLAFLALMTLILGFAVFPSFSAHVATVMGFTLQSNFFFAVLIGVLILLHLSSILTISKLEARTVTLTQELGLIHEQLSRSARESAADVKDATARPG